MDISKLHYYCTVVQTGSITKASELLYISQPALSKAIKSLEAELGETLVSPSGRGIVITDKGHQLAEMAIPLIEKIHGLPEQLRKVSTEKKRVRLASFEVFTTYFFGQLCKKEFAGDEVVSFELTPGHLEEAIINHKADIGLTYLPIPSPDLDFLKITSLKMVVAGLRTKFEKAEFPEIPFVTPNIPVHGSPSKNKGLDGWPDDAYPRKILYRVAMLETALELCRQGLCVGFFPQFIVELQNEIAKPKYHLQELRIPKSYKIKRSFDIYLVKRKSDLESSVSKRIARLLRQICL